MPLIGPGDPAPFELVNEQGGAPALVVCDHASRTIPASLNRLGMPEVATWQHVAWDIGAAELARGLAAALDTPAILAGYSRLVVDCNRHPDHPEAFRTVSDGWEVPGNRSLGRDERLERLAGIFDPYHQCIAAMLGGFKARGTVPLLISVHTFTPWLAGVDRPWHVGVLWDKDEDSAREVLRGLRALDALVVGDNEPYSGRHPADFTIDHHAEARGLPHVCIEVRQDQFGSPADTVRWVERLSGVLGTLLANLAVRKHQTVRHANP